jgi:hypothetical protein
MNPETKRIVYPFLAQVALFLAVAGTDAYIFHPEPNDSQHLINMGLLILATIAKEWSFRGVAPDYMKGSLFTAVRLAVDALIVFASTTNSSVALGFTAVRVLNTVTNTQEWDKRDSQKK